MDDEIDVVVEWDEEDDDGLLEVVVEVTCEELEVDVVEVWDEEPPGERRK